MQKLTILLCLVSLFLVSGCGMKRALTLPENNKKQADEKDLMEF